MICCIILLLSIKITLQEVDPLHLFEKEWVFDTLVTTHFPITRYEGPVVGVHFGTDFSTISIYRNNTVQLLAVVPSVVSFTEIEQIFVGEAAKHQGITDPANTVFGIKRLLGRWIGDREVDEENKYQPYKIVSKQGEAWVKIEHKGRTKLFSSTQIASFILIELKKRAEDSLETKLNNAVFITSHRFNCTRIKSLVEAADMARFTVLGFMHGVTGVLAHRYWRTSTRKYFVAAVHIGGSSLSFSLISMEPTNKIRTYDIIKVKGSATFGAIDFNRRIMDKFMEFYWKQTGKHLKEDGNLLSELGFSAERAKRALATVNETTIEVNNISIVLTRLDFEEMNKDIFELIETSIRDVFALLIYNIGHVDKVYLSGDATIIPKIREIAAKLFHSRSPSIIDAALEEYVAGAAVMGASLSLDEGPSMPLIKSSAQGHYGTYSCKTQEWKVKNGKVKTSDDSINQDDNNFIHIENEL